MDADGEIPYAFARCLQESLWSLCRLEHQHGLTFTRDGFSDGTRAGAADLFISIEEDCYRTMARLELAHSAQREQHHDNPSLHVQHTWTVGAPPFQAKRHGCQGAQRPDSIEVAEQHDWLLICSAGEFDLKMITVIGCFVDFCPPAHPRK